MRWWQHLRTRFVRVRIKESKRLTMASFYIVAQYVPDPMIDERINIGVFVYGEGEDLVLCHFLHDWQRVKCFGNQDTAFLQEFVASMTDAAKNQKRRNHDPVIPMEAKVNRQELEEMIPNWCNSIQFTPPRGAILSPERLLMDVGAQFLREPEHRPLQNKTRIQAASAARKSILHVLRPHVGPRVEELVKWNGSIKGDKEKNKFDIVVGNGVPFWVTQGQSFEGADSEQRHREISDLLWRIQDVRLSNDSLPIAIAAYPPTEAGDAYEGYRRVKDLGRQLAADVIPVEEFEEWAQRQSEAVADQLEAYKQAPASNGQTGSVPHSSKRPTLSP